MLFRQFDPKVSAHALSTRDDRFGVRCDIDAVECYAHSSTGAPTTVSVVDARDLFIVIRVDAADSLVRQSALEVVMNDIDVTDSATRDVADQTALISAKTSLHLRLRADAEHFVRVAAQNGDALRRIAADLSLRGLAHGMAVAEHAFAV